MLSDSSKNALKMASEDPQNILKTLKILLKGTKNMKLSGYFSDLVREVVRGLVSPMPFMESCVIYNKKGDLGGLLKKIRRIWI